MSSKLNLSQMPEVVMTRILKECDFCSFYTLRKVCHTLRDSIDDIKPETNLSHITIVSQFDAVKVNLNFKNDQESINLGFKYQEIGCLVRCGERQKILEDRNYMEAAITDIKTILSHRKSELETLNLQFMPKCTLHPKDFSFFEMFEKISNSSKSLFQIRTLSTNCLDQDQVMQILPYLNPKILKKLDFSNQEIIKIEKFEKLEQWKFLEEFYTMFATVPEEDFHKLTKIPRVRIGTKILTGVGIEVLKEAFSTSLTTPESFEICCFSPDVIPNLTKSFGEPVIVEPIIPRRLARWIDPIAYTRWFYPIKGTTDDVIYISKAHSTIDFRRIKASEVGVHSVAHRIGRKEDQDTDDDEN